VWDGVHTTQHTHNTTTQQHTTTRKGTTYTTRIITQHNTTTQQHYDTTTQQHNNTTTQQQHNNTTTQQHNNNNTTQQPNNTHAYLLCVLLCCVLWEGGRGSMETDSLESRKTKEKMKKLLGWSPQIFLRKFFEGKLEENLSQNLKDSIGIKYGNPSKKTPTSSGCW
jgi:hypothetical protein